MIRAKTAQSIRIVWALLMMLAPFQALAGPLEERPIRIERSELEAGDVLSEQLVSMLNMKVVTKHGLELEEEALSIESSRERTATVLATDGEVIHELMLTYGKVRRAITDEKGRDEKVLPLEGKSYHLETDGDELEVTLEDGTHDAALEAEVRKDNPRVGRSPDVLLRALAGVDLEVGQVIRLDADTIKEFLYGREGMSGEDFSFTYLGVEVDDGVEWGVFELEQTTFKLMHSGHKETTKTTGRMRIRVDRSFEVEVESRGAVVFNWVTPDREQRGTGTLDVRFVTTFKR